MSEKPRIFISYSRKDEHFAHEVRAALKEHEFPLWQDRPRMEGGVDWWQQITEALDVVEYMVLIVQKWGLLEMLNAEAREARRPLIQARAPIREKHRAGDKKARGEYDATLEGS